MSKRINQILCNDIPGTSREWTTRGSLSLLLGINPRVGPVAAAAQVGDSFQDGFGVVVQIVLATNHWRGAIVAEINFVAMTLQLGNLKIPDPHAPPDI
ncbi:MAG: hypothetical protein VCE75_02545 [Alphaproteobacteria bacterium]